MTTPPTQAWRTDPENYFLGRDAIGLGFVEVSRGESDFRRLEHRENVALLHALADLGLDARDPPRHRREDVSDVRVVEGDPTAREDHVIDVLSRLTRLHLAWEDELGSIVIADVGRLLEFMEFLEMPQKFEEA